MSTCKQCGNVGHRPSDKSCPTMATDEIQQSIETFQGSRCKLSNLHQCPHSCEIEDLGTKFPISEYHYQFKKLKAHNLGTEAYELLMEEDSFKAMKKVKSLIPDSDVSDEWKQVACKEIMSSNRLKYTSCQHIKDTLLHSKITIAEATGNLFWGTGLGVQQSLDCLPDFWPGENHIGWILMELRAEFQAEL